MPVLTAAAYLVKVVPALLFRSLFPWRETLAGGVLLSARLSLIIAAGAIALNLDLISLATHSAVILVAVVTGTLSAVIFAKIIPSPAGAERAGTIILGANQLAVFLGDRLRRTGESIVFVARDNRQLAHLRRMKYRVVVGQPNDEGVLDQAGVSNASALIAIPDDPQIGLKVCRLARERFGIPHVIALAGIPLRRVRLPGNVLVLGIRRAGEALVPHGDTVLQKGDIMMLVGSRDALHEAKRLLQGLYWAL